MLDPQSAAQPNPVNWMPVARADDLVMAELDGEVLIYDLARHKAFALNPTAALVWRQCDGQTPMPRLAELRLRPGTPPLGEAVVWLALRQLAERQLLAPTSRLPETAPRYSRLQLLRAGAVGGAVLLPVIAAIVAPTAAHAASCGQDCSGTGTCAPGCHCNGTTCVLST